MLGATVQLYPANVLVTDPNMHLGRFEGVFLSVNHEAKLPLYSHGRHTTSPRSGDLRQAVAMHQVYHFTTHP